MYVNDAIPGISRRRAGHGFAYYDARGTLIRDRATIERIKKLAIPPAYTHVWICPFENGHIQATGRDARGRKQYRYHPKWIELTNSNKFGKLLAFGSKIPQLRERIDADLRRHGVPKEKACATVLWLLEKSLIRVGNEEYAKENKSYGLTTMRMRHVNIEGSSIEFKFIGKRGIKHMIRLSDRRIAKVLRQISELPGQELFHYVAEDGSVETISSTDVNAYLKEIAGDEFTAKDFRTWAATVQALQELASCCEYRSKKEARQTINRALANVSRQLGNTPAICRKSYVHPMVLHSFLDGTLERFLESTNPSDLEEAESVALAFLRHVEDTANLRNLPAAVKSMRKSKAAQ